MASGGYDQTEYMPTVPNFRVSQSANASPENSMTGESREAQDTLASCLSLRSNRRLPVTEVDATAPSLSSPALFQGVHGAVGSHAERQQARSDHRHDEASSEDEEVVTPVEEGHRQDSQDRRIDSEDESTASAESGHRQEPFDNQDESAAPVESGHRQEPFDNQDESAAPAESDTDHGQEPFDNEDESAAPVESGHRLEPINNEDESAAPAESGHRPEPINRRNYVPTKTDLIEQLSGQPLAQEVTKRLKSKRGGFLSRIFGCITPQDSHVRWRRRSGQSDVTSSGYSSMSHIHSKSSVAGTSKRSFVRNSGEASFSEGIAVAETASVNGIGEQIGVTNGRPVFDVGIDVHDGGVCTSV